MSGYAPLMKKPESRAAARAPRSRVKTHMGAQEMRRQAQVQPELEVHESGDEFEREADEVADELMRSEGQSAGEGAPEAEGSSGSSQTVGAAGRVQREVAPSVEAQADAEDVQLEAEEPEAEEELTGGAGEVQLQRAGGEPGDEDEPEQEAEAGEAVQLARGGETDSEDAGSAKREESDLGERLREARLTGGEPLPGPVRSWFARGLGYSLDRVRVHTDERAHELAVSLGARALTQGEHIYFKRGAYSPGTRAGRRLLAHEVTHVVQQGTGMRAGAVRRGWHERVGYLARERAERAAGVSQSAPRLVGLGGWPVRGASQQVQREVDSAVELGPGARSFWTRHADGTPEPQLRPRFGVELSAERLAREFGVSVGAQSWAVVQLVRTLLDAGLRVSGEAFAELLNGRGQLSECLVRSEAYELQLRVEQGSGGGAQRSYCLRERGKLGSSEGKKLAEGGRGAAGRIAEWGGGGRRVVDVTGAGVRSLPELEAWGAQLPRHVGVWLGRSEERVAERNEEQRQEGRGQAPGEQLATSESTGAEFALGVELAETGLESTESESVRSAEELLEAQPLSVDEVEAAAEEAAAGPRGEAERIEAQLAELSAKKRQVEPELSLNEEAEGESGPQAEGQSLLESVSGLVEVVGAVASGGAFEAVAEAESLEGPAVDPQVAAEEMELRLEGVTAPGELEEELAVGELDEGTETEALEGQVEEELRAEPLESAPELDDTGLGETELSAEESDGELDVEEPPPTQTTEPDAGAEGSWEDDAAEEPSAALAGSEEELALDEIGEEAAVEGLLPEERSEALSALGEGAMPQMGGGTGGLSLSAVTEAPAPEPAPEVAEMKPTEALGAVAHLRVGQMQEALGGLGESARVDAAKRRQELEESPPSLERPTGSPLTKADARKVPPAAELGLGADVRAIGAVPSGVDVRTAEPEPLGAPPPLAVAGSRVPAVQESGEGGTVAPEAAQRMSGQLAGLPTRDEALGVRVSEAPVVQLEGNADPQRLVEQHGEFREKASEARLRGAKEAAQPMGEALLYPDVEPEVLQARVPGRGVEGSVQSEGISASRTVEMLAESERGAEVRAAAEGARGAAEAEQGVYGEEVQGAQTAHLEAVAEAEQESAESQKAEREKAQDEVSGARGAWAGEQDAALLEKGEEASLELKEAAEEIREEKQEGEKQAAEEIQEGNEAARVAQERGEKDAEAEKQKGERESEGFFGWVARKAKAFFARVQKAISQALERARALVRESLEKAKRFAVGLVEKARKAVVGLIQQAGKALIALGGALLADFPALREKWTQAIESVVTGAEAGINRLADALKTTVVSLLDTLGGALDGALGLLDRGLRAAVGLVAKAVDGALQFAQAIADKLGVFADLVGDIAGDPLGWLRNLGSSIKDGLENHLWTELKAAVLEWFGSKVEGLLSVGKTVWSLVTGELGLSAVLQMAWKEVQAMLPKALAEILVKKLMAMLVPAAGALLAIVEALQAAWGTVSRMIASIELFVSFLKAVKGGGAGKKFAIALASAAVVVLDFVANYLLRKIGDGLRKLSGKLRGLAQHLQKKQRAKKAKGRRGSQVRRVRAGGRKPQARGASTAARAQRQREKEKRQARRRLMRARSQIRRALARSIPVKRAKVIISRIARQNRVQFTTRDQGKQFAVGLFVNPRLRDFGFPKIEMRAIQRSLEDLGLSAASLERKFTEDWRKRVIQILGPVQELDGLSEDERNRKLGALSKKKLTKEQLELSGLPPGSTVSDLAKVGVRNEFGEQVKQVGADRAVESLATALPAQVREGRKAESKAIADYSKNFKADPQGQAGVFIDGRGRRVIFIPRQVDEALAEVNPELAKLYEGAQGSGGSDFAVIVLSDEGGVPLATPELLLGDVKTKLGEQFASASSKSTAQSIARGKALEHQVPKGMTTLEYVENHPEEALSGQAYRVDEEGKKRQVKNQLSSMTVEETYKKNLQGFRRRIQDAIRNLPKQHQGTEALEYAARLFQDAINDRIAPERIIRTVREPNKWERAIVKAFAVSAKKLKLVENRTRRAVAQIGSDGDLLGGKEE